MKIILYKNTAPERKVNKTNFLSLVMEMDGFLRDESSVMNPVFMLETRFNLQLVQANGEDVVANGELIEYNYQVADTMPEFNYAYIPDFKRYYFLGEIVSVRERLWRVSFRCDVLMSFKSDFVKEGLYFFCERSSEAPASEVLDDPLISWSEKEEITITDLSPDATLFDVDVGNVGERRITLYTQVNGPRRAQIYPFRPSGIGSETYGKAPWETGATVPPNNIQELPRITGNAVQVNTQTIPYAITIYQMGMIQRALNIDDSKTSFIVSAVAWPFIVQSSFLTSDFYLLAIGDTVIEDYDTSVDMEAKAVKTGSILPYVTLAIFDAPTIDSYMLIPQHCVYDVFLPYYGWAPLDLVAHGGHKIVIYYALSLIDGSGTVNMFDQTAKCMIFTAPVQVGRKIIMTTTNNRENQVQSNSVALNGALGAIGSALGIAGGIATGNPLLIAGGIASGISTIGKTVIGAQSIIERGSVSYGSDATTFFSPLKPYLRRKRKLPAIVYGSSEYVQFNSLKGHPVKSTICLHDYNQGYFLLSDSKHISSGTATDGELVELQSILNSGFYL